MRALIAIIAAVSFVATRTMARDQWTSQQAHDQEIHYIKSVTGKR
jgi:hypothetical protein